MISRPILAVKACHRSVHHRPDERPQNPVLRMRNEHLLTVTASFRLQVTYLHMFTYRLTAIRGRICGKMLIILRFYVQLLNYPCFICRKFNLTLGLRRLEIFEGTATRGFRVSNSDGGAKYYGPPFQAYENWLRGAIYYALRFLLKACVDKNQGCQPSYTQMFRYFLYLPTMRSSVSWDKLYVLLDDAFCDADDLFCWFFCCLSCMLGPHRQATTASSIRISAPPHPPRTRALVWSPSPKRANVEQNLSYLTWRLLGIECNLNVT